MIQFINILQQFLKSISTTMAKRGQRPNFAAVIAFLSITCISSATTATSVGNTHHAASQWKAPNNETPPELAQQWREEDEDLHAYIEASVPAVLDHTGSTAFDEHLRGVQSILRCWGAPDYLYNAGLFHSICKIYCCISDCV